MVESTFRMSEYTFTRQGLPPVGVAGEVKVMGEVSSDETLLYLDYAIGFLHGASEAFEREIECCEKGSDRAGEVANLLSKVRDIQRAIEKLPRM